MFTKKNSGFTLPELMTTLLVLAILMAVAIPVFIGARDRAIARAAQERLKNAVTAAKNVYNDNDIDYNNQGATDLSVEAQPISFTDGSTPQADSTQVYITASTANTITFQTRDGNDRIWQAAIASSGAVTYLEVTP